MIRRGVVTPAMKAGAVPGRVINAKSKRSQVPNKIRLDKLLRSAHPRICIKRRLGGIGDVLMTTPITKAIKMLIPKCHLVYATDLKYSQGALGDIIQHNPYVDELISADHVSEERYDYVVDITTTGLDKERSGTIPPNRIDLFADAVGIDISADPVPVYNVEQSEREWAKEFVSGIVKNRNNETKIIAIQARSNDARRTWPLDKVDELSKILAVNNTHVLLFDWGDTVSRWKDENSNLHYIMDRKLTEVAAIVEQCDIVICPDSAMLHLAGALHKKIVTIFGPIPPQSRINYYSNATAVTKNLPCQYCWYTPRCMKSEGNKLECLISVTPAEVKEMVDKKLLEKHKVDSNIIYGQDLTTKNQDKVIMVRRLTDGIGDILMTTPTIEALAKKYAGMKIEVACQRRLWPVLENNPHISRLVDVTENVNPKRYFMIADISTPCARYESTRVAMGKPVQKSRVEIYAEACGVRDDITSLKPRYYITEEEKKWAEDFIKTTDIDPNKPLLAVGLRSAEQYRDWPENNFNELFERLYPHTNIIILDHSREHIFKNTIDACGFSIRKAAAILSRCSCLLTVDTSLVHFSAALDIPAIAIFGPIDYRPRCKGYDKVTIVKSDMPCMPCWRNSKTSCSMTGLIKGYSKCMTVIKPSDVSTAVINKLAGAK